MTDAVFQNCGAILPEKAYRDKFEHEEIDTCARIEISQDVDNADQKVKWFLKVDKTCKLLWEACFQFFPKFLFMFTFYKFFDPPPPPKMKVSEIDKNNSLLQHFGAFSTILPSFRFLSVIA